MKKIYLKSDEPRKELYRIILKELSKKVDEYNRQSIKDLIRNTMQNKDNKSND